MRLKSLIQCNKFLEEYYHGMRNQTLRVLEAGGGSFSYFTFPASTTLTTLDISFHQLMANRVAHSRVQGDIQALPYAKDVFDVIICFNVIEHLCDPNAAITGLLNSLCSNGILILGWPDRTSLKGIVTRITPIGLHRWYYRTIVGKKDRGGGHFDAFPTVHNPFIERQTLISWLRSCGCCIEFFCHYDGTREYRIVSGAFKPFLVGAVMWLIGIAGIILTVGKWKPLKSDILLVARKAISNQDKKRIKEMIFTANAT